MPIETVEVKRGVQVPVDGRVHTAEFTVKVSGKGDDWDDAQRHATSLAEHGVEEFLETVESGGSGPDARQALPARPETPMVSLIFDATNSKPRSDRIMRATTEEMTFEPGPDGEGWICTAHNGRQFRVDANKDAGLGRCDCEDFLNRGVKGKMPCKHIYALVMSAERFWDDTDRKERRAG